MNDLSNMGDNEINDIASLILSHALVTIPPSSCLENLLNRHFQFFSRMPSECNFLDPNELKDWIESNINDYSFVDFSTIIKKNEIELNKTNIIPRLNEFISIYLVSILAWDLFFDNLKKIATDLKKLERQALKMQKTVLSLNEKTQALVTIGVLGDKAIDSISLLKEVDIKEVEENLFFKRIEKLKNELEYFSQIKSIFEDTRFAKYIQFAKSGPKSKKSLEIWIGNMAKTWVLGLKRSLSIPTNEFDGREKFLRFLEDCFEKIHPEIEADTIRHSFEKMRKNGSFEYSR